MAFSSSTLHLYFKKLRFFAIGACFLLINHVFYADAPLYGAAAAIAKKEAIAENPECPELTKLSFAKEPFRYVYDEGRATFRWENRLRLDSFYSKNARLLNNDNCGLDKVLIPGRFIFDSALHHFYYNELSRWDTVHAKIGIRMKGTFGAPWSTYQTAPTTTKDLDIVADSHYHPLSVNLPVIREIWGEYVVNDLLGIPFEGKHTLTAGLFPFSLGRGIALGDAYAVAPDFIGYDPAAMVDQYAPGIKLSGELMSNHFLDYDFYAGIDDNFADSFNAVNLKTQGQFYGRRFNQARGYPIIDYVIAGRLKMTPVAQKNGSLYLEPYILFNDERTQKVEISGDASSKLVTLGFSFEVTAGDFEFGWDCAQNFGHQRVKGLDRNIVSKELRTTNSIDGNGNISVPVYVNSHVVLVDKPSVKVPFNVDSALQAAIYKPIDQSVACSSLKEFNDQILPVTLPNQGGNPLAVRNAKNRFRDPYTNKLTGRMFVGDMTYKWSPCLRFSATVGYSTGGENPNRDLDRLGDSEVDGAYDGFIGLQEIYSGRRVRSAFVMSGYGRIPRVLSVPVNKELNPEIDVPTNEFPTSISRFTNLAFIGASCWYEYEDGIRKWEFNPNILSFWQPVPPRTFDFKTRTRTQFYANRHLGTELNIYIDTMVAPGLKMFLVSGVFISGKYYDDLKGLPLSRAERAYLNFVNRTGQNQPADLAAVLGDDNAFFMNLGIEYKF